MKDYDYYNCPLNHLPGTVSVAVAVAVLVVAVVGLVVVAVVAHHLPRHLCHRHPQNLLDLVEQVVVGPRLVVVVVVVVHLEVVVGHLLVGLVVHLEVVVGHLLVELVVEEHLVAAFAVLGQLEKNASALIRAYKERLEATRLLGRRKLLSK